MEVSTVDIAAEYHVVMRAWEWEAELHEVSTSMTNCKGTRPSERNHGNMGWFGLGLRGCLSQH